MLRQNSGTRLLAYVTLPFAIVIAYSECHTFLFLFKISFSLVVFYVCWRPKNKNKQHENEWGECALYNWSSTTSSSITSAWRKAINVKDTPASARRTFATRQTHSLLHRFYYSSSLSSSSSNFANKNKMYFSFFLKQFHYCNDDPSALEVSQDVFLTFWKKHQLSLS